MITKDSKQTIVHRLSSNRSIFLTLLLTIVYIGISSETANAAEYWETVRDNALVVLGSFKGDYTVQQEVDKINENWRKYEETCVQNGLTSVAQVVIDETYPVAQYFPPDDFGMTETLSYCHINPVTNGILTTPSDVFGVRYEALLEPPTTIASEMTISLIQDNITVLGTSTDAANNFPLPFTITEDYFEPIIRAVPVDEQGNDLTETGFSGFCCHVVPEPATLLLLAISAPTLLLRRR